MSYKSSPPLYAWVWKRVYASYDEKESQNSNDGRTAFWMLEQVRHDGGFECFKVEFET